MWGQEITLALLDVGSASRITWANPLLMLRCDDSSYAIFAATREDLMRNCGVLGMEDENFVVVLN